MSSPKLTLVAATRLAETAFWSQSALGLSLRRLQADDRLVPRIAFSNSRGLPLIYNAAIESASASEWVLFVHDASGSTTSFSWTMCTRVCRPSTSSA